MQRRHPNHSTFRPDPGPGDHPICLTCGTQFETVPVGDCPVCADDRQYVDWSGQRWATHSALAARHTIRIERDGDLWGVGLHDPFAIPQRALLAPTSIGNVMWDCLSVVTPDGVERLEQLGGVELIAISHPHFYAAMVEWSDALGGVPVMVHHADRTWIRRSSPNVRTWSGDRLDLAADATLVHLPGHFPGSAALLHRDPTTHRRSLLVGDSLMVGRDRRQISLVHSVPNHIPVGPHVVRDVQRRLADLDFDDVYGYTWGLNILGGARQVVDRSLMRYLDTITGDASPTDVRHVMMS